MDLIRRYPLKKRIRKKWTNQMEPYRSQTARIARPPRSQWQTMQRKVSITIPRYITYINPSHPKEEWSFADEQRMFDLHNDLGNKWAVIGAKLAGR